MKENSSEISSKDEKKPISKKKVLIAVILISVAFFGSFLLYFILQIALNTETPMVVVVSGSMSPTYNEGDLLFVKGVDPSDIRNMTDVIVFDAHGVWISPPDEPVVHRVVNTRYAGSYWEFQTKGDNNPTIDENGSGVWVPEYKIYGIVCGRIPYIGWVKIFLTETGLLIPLLIIISALLIISIIRDVIKGDNKKEKEEINTEKIH